MILTRATASNTEKMDERLFGFLTSIVFFTIG